MKNIVSDFDFTKIGYLQSILESAGIQTFVRNRDVASLAGEGAIAPALWPTLAVVNDDDYPRAIELLRERTQQDAEDSETERACPTCGEMNPGNFEICWSCGASLITAASE